MGATHALFKPFLPDSTIVLDFSDFPLQLTETSSRYARKISGTTALQEALKEKQQHIEQLLAERDLERAEVAKATSHVGEIEQELALARDGHDQVKTGVDLVPMVMVSKLSGEVKKSAWHSEPGGWLDLNIGNEYLSLLKSCGVGASFCHHKVLFFSILP